MKLFQKAAVAIMIFYFGLMFFVAIYAHLKPSGSTGMDMMKIHMNLHDKTADRP
jgi:hypothetical protein